LEKELLGSIDGLRSAVQITCKAVYHIINVHSASSGETIEQQLQKHGIPVLTCYPSAQSWMREEERQPAAYCWLSVYVCRQCTETEFSITLYGRVVFLSESAENLKTINITSGFYCLITFCGV